MMKRLIRFPTKGTTDFIDEDLDNALKDLITSFGEAQPTCEAAQQILATFQELLTQHLGQEFNVNGVPLKLVKAFACYSQQAMSDLFNLVVTVAIMQNEYDDTAKNHKYVATETVVSLSTKDFEKFLPQMERYDADFIAKLIESIIYDHITQALFQNMSDRLPSEKQLPPKGRKIIPFNPES